MGSAIDRARVERAARRFVQVALDNAVRHAQASAISVSLSVESTSVWITVADDGRGYDVAAPGRAGARGIRDARHAAAEIGASVEIGTNDDRGAIATFRWLTPPS